MKIFDSIQSLSKKTWLLIVSVIGAILFTASILFSRRKTTTLEDIQDKADDLVDEKDKALIRKKQLDKDIEHSTQSIKIEEKKQLDELKSARNQTNIDDRLNSLIKLHGKVK